MVNANAAVAPLVFLLFSFIVIGFQLALIAGAPWGHLTLGGKYPTILPPQLRLVCLFTIIIFVAFIVMVLTRAGWILPQWFQLSTTLIWAVVLYCFVGVIANALTPSRYERMLWLPASTGLFASSLNIATAW